MSHPAPEGGSSPGSQRFESCPAHSHSPSEPEKQILRLAVTFSAKSVDILSDDLTSERRKDTRQEDRTVDHGSLLLCDLRKRRGDDCIRILSAKILHRFGALEIRLRGVGAIHRRANAWHTAIPGSVRSAELRGFRYGLAERIDL